MAKKALIVWGGWDGHEPEQVAHIFKDILMEENIHVEMSDTLEAYADAEKLKSFDLIVPHWTMGQIKDHYVHHISDAVQLGVGIAGCHGGMCDSFRDNVLWQFITGGNWVAHPGDDGVEYTVHVKHSSSPLLNGIDDFNVCSEQYYMHVDPAVEVLATTRFPVREGPHVYNKAVDMPVVWTKRWGQGRVFYCSLGHKADIIRKPEVTTMMRRGLMWAAEGKVNASRS
ncbi:ThuA domain-containing protein [Salipaludibacillus agaradhaerens]|uniref:ThuA domain-containing protein n=1 Tax=Salipaludibacillus agaradhaerens TaxID=76935 RepID=A0A9Q4B5L6_SALAG|nr:ThuA domain-containing protein [Salipaludibacillus agaradhaerens]MCR6098773.1 ThuA domain-containing protein [Salipaludibacillus agaradhaerens]MCR6115780.1 ThuA domain-containing protein [Salipaludibacillus agaradhaerens]